MTVRQTWNSFRHCTWNGRASILWYAMRRLVVDPAPANDRCIMGYPIGPEIRCPQRAVNGGLWCKRHQPEDER